MDSIGGADCPAVLLVLVIRLGQGATPEPLNGSYASLNGESQADRTTGTVAPHHGTRVLDHIRRHCEQRSGRDPRGLGLTRR